MSGVCDGVPVRTGSWRLYDNNWAQVRVARGIANGLIYGICPSTRSLVSANATLVAGFQGL